MCLAHLKSRLELCFLGL
ncbi:rCG63149 [Rattus norvegicus]|uniref:RCG63149 n=1 Tax=Rattus norvegicus TaxID=10116 RepID=A6K811_RAT|nr:rCG63149 [Rattus norvegicus]